MKISRIQSICALIIIGVALGGCATIFSGTSQNIHVKIIESQTNTLLDNASCTVTDGSGGNYAVVGNPGTVRVRRSSGGVQVNCRKEGYRQLNTAVGDDFNAVTLVNVLFWPGFIVDAVSGSYRKYPSHYVVSMEKIAVSKQ